MQALSRLENELGIDFVNGNGVKFTMVRYLMFGVKNILCSIADYGSINSCLMLP
jgi:hypothetical protein